jgi:hypothetical protein
MGPQELSFSQCRGLSNCKDKECLDFEQLKTVGGLTNLP